MRAIIALTAVPIAALVAYQPRQSPPIVAKAVALEGVREARQDDSTFQRRWSATASMPPATVITRVANDRVIVKPKSPTTLTQSKHASLRRDLCGRHGMKKVWITTKRWRCRR